MIRLANEKDANDLLSLTLRAYEPIRKMEIPFTAATATLTTVLDNINKNAVYVLEEDGRIIATISVRYPWTENHPLMHSHPFIWWFAVDPLHKGRGVGSKLLTYVETNVLKKNLKAPGVFLATSAQHPWLQSIYQRRNYRVFDRKEKDGHEIVFMTKSLSDSCGKNNRMEECT